MSYEATSHTEQQQEYRCNDERGETRSSQGEKCEWNDRNECRKQVGDEHPCGLDERIFLFQTSKLEFRGRLDFEKCLGVTSERIDDSRGVLVVKTSSSQSIPDFLFLSFQIFVDLGLLLCQSRFCL